MFLSLLSYNPLLALVWVLAIVMSLTIHEFSHALVGKWRGDKTAEREGRLTLNPLAHIDLMGFIPLLLLGFGWAKPVPYNPYNLKDQKWDAVLIALAGPAANFLLAAVAAIIFRLALPSALVTGLSLLHAFLILSALLNLFLLFFNVIPIHPLDGSKLVFALFAAPKYEQLRRFILIRGPQILLFAVVISLLTNIDVFAFVSAPAYATCSALVGLPCGGLLAAIFGG
ncbi:MAG: site-2 protease family protein [Patescibacteria group bacterium]